MLNQRVCHHLRYCTLFVVSLLFQPITVQAADWTLLAADDDKEVEVDRQSLRPNKGAWFKYINTPPEDDACGIGKKKAYSKNYVEANCKEFTIRSKQSIAYSQDGETLPYCGFDTPLAPFTEFAPETIGELYFNAICRPTGRVESKFAAYVRQRKAAKQEAEEQAAKTIQRNREAEEARRNPTLKLQGDTCNKSSECGGLLVCARINPTQMQCMSSDVAIRLNQAF